jgi:Fe-S-cluster-containing dehydrogenase component/formate-dependent nitrite reductase membrane component NrfD
VQLGFVIDHSRCIGCHACTVACKSENDVPVGSFRTWVKYTERGTFPEVRRSFAVLRCNQCTDAPCVEICPVSALHKREDGIVDVDASACVGCKACMQGCPYDALYLNPDNGTAEKCHFCAHRVERGLAPACATVCPTEAIIPGDFHDPESMVAKMRASMPLEARKTEAGTGPNVLYREVDSAGISPMETNAAGGYLWSDQREGEWQAAESFQAASEPAQARTTYDVDHPALWGFKITAYLFMKSMAAGLFLLIGILALGANQPSLALVRTLSLGALAALSVTTLLLVTDLAKPARFLYLVLRPNWNSWLAKGSFILMGYAALLTFWIAALFLAPTEGLVARIVYGLGAILALLSACYTAWLFQQSKARVLWMRRGLAGHLVVQAIVVGTAVGCLICRLPLVAAVDAQRMRWTLVAALAAHALFIATEHWMAPRRREDEYRRASNLVVRGPYARRRWGLGVALGIVLPLSILLLSASSVGLIIAGAMALIGLWVEEDTLVRAGQALANS